MITTRLHPDPMVAAREVARGIADLIEARARRGEPTVLGLATGSTPGPVYAELVRLHREERLSFRTVHTFNLDEYVGLGPTHPRSYRRFMEETLFQHIDLPPSHVNFLDGQAPDTTAACAGFEDAIRRMGGIDIQLLGIGRTGHIGFNEPPSPVDCRTRRIPLDQLTRQDNAVFFDSPAAVPSEALTMGVATILEARELRLLAFGRTKAAVVRRALDEPPNAGCPATWLQAHPRCIFHLDLAAHLPASPR